MLKTDRHEIRQGDAKALKTLNVRRRCSLVSNYFDHLEIIVFTKNNNISMLTATSFGSFRI